MKSQEAKRPNSIHYKYHVRPHCFKAIVNTDNSFRGSQPESRAEGELLTVLSKIV